MKKNLSKLGILILIVGGLFALSPYGSFFLFRMYLWSSYMFQYQGLSEYFYMSLQGLFYILAAISLLFAISTFLLKRKHRKYLIYSTLALGCVWYFLPPPMTPLMQAAKDGDIHKLQKEIENYAWINRKGPEGLTALIFAAKNGHTEAVSILLEEGANPNIKTRYNWTALMFASRNGHKDVVEELIEAGANVNITSGEVPSAFATTAGYPETNALAEAIEKNTEIAKLLIEKEATIDKKVVASAVREENLELLEDFWQRKGDFSNSLCDAMWLNYTKMESIKWLLEKGVNPNEPCPSICDATKMYYSHLKGEDKERNDALRTTKLLVEYGADPNISCDERDFETPLRNALWGRNIDLVRFLLEKGADPNKRIQYGETALFTAYDLESAKLLIKYGADIHHKADNGWTAAKSIQHYLDFALERQPSTTSEEHVRTKQKLIQYLSE